MRRRFAAGSRSNISIARDHSSLEVTQNGRVPSRRRRKAPAPEIVDPVTQFGRMLRESSERERVARAAAVRRRHEAEAAAKAATEQAEALKSARQELERAIARVKEARSRGHSRAEADAAWKAAKARLIELETGERPAWHRPDSPPAVSDHD